MSKSRNVGTSATVYALASVILMLFLATVVGVFGQACQWLAISLTFFVVPLCIRLFVRSCVFLLNRICRHCREDLSTTCENDTATCDSNTTSKRLNSTFDTMRREEMSCADRRARRRCSSDDLVRAKSLRIQAEMGLLRHETMPKPGTEDCKKRLSRTRLTHGR